MFDFWKNIDMLAARLSKARKDIRVLSWKNSAPRCVRWVEWSERVRRLEWSELSEVG